ncbi:hypothetical protein Ac2012v2_001375 [Leucoagaricus gongylophorus]
MMLKKRLDLLKYRFEKIDNENALSFKIPTGLTISWAPRHACNVGLAQGITNPKPIQFLLSKKILTGPGLRNVLMSSWKSVPSVRNNG